MHHAELKVDKEYVKLVFAKIIIKIKQINNTSLYIVTFLTGKKISSDVEVAKDAMYIYCYQMPD